MYSGFVTPRRVVKKLGIHQRFDVAAYRLAAPYFADAAFPPIKDIIHFEGFNGPDGLKVKSPGEMEPSHLYDPVTGTGEVPMHIANHYRKLVRALQKKDLIRAAFEASWMAHYVTDGLTPAHHFPLEDEVAKLRSEAKDAQSFYKKNIVSGETISETMKKNWALWGAKGLYTSHVNFEAGVATALILYPIRVKFNESKLAEARKVGYLEFFKQEAADIAKLNLYEKFLEQGWSVELASIIRRQIAPQTAQTIAIIWMLAYLEAGLNELTGQIPAR